jgi:hypothetical protein
MDPEAALTCQLDRDRRDGKVAGMRSLRRAALSALLILLAAGHVAYWYWPRERMAAPPPGSATEAVLLSADLPLRAWVAFPHQNLAFLASADSGENWQRGLSDLLGVPKIDMPELGPFAVPPASGLAVASDEQGERLVAAVRIYPGLAWFARAAGKVAGNPWLAGGEVVEGGRRLEVAWRGRTWMLRTPGEEWPVAADSSAGVVPALLRLALEVPLGPMPAGEYRLERRGAHLDLLSATAANWEPTQPEVGVLMMTERRPAGLSATAVLGPGQGSLRGVPSAVTFAQSGVAVAPLPLEKLYRVLGVKRRTGEATGWTLEASDRLALERGRELLPGLERAAARVGPTLVYSVDLDVVRAVSADLEERFEGVPLPAISELRQWRAAASILRELAAYDRWSLEVGEDGREVRSRLWRAD